jgi:hypothetical protein
MRIRAWPIILIAGIAVLAIAVMFRDEIWDLMGHDPGGRSVFGFASKPTDSELARVRELIEHRLSDLPVTIRTDGDRIVIEGKRTLDLMEVDERVRQTTAAFAPIELRILDYDPAYLNDVRKALIGNARAKELGVEVKLDHYGYHLEAPHKGMYVNEAWAAAHHCPTTDRLTGTGYYCTVTGRDRIEAFLKGDEALFVTALDVPPLPADRELVIGDDGTVARGYIVERAPILLDARAITEAIVADDGLVVSLSQPGIDSLAARAGPAVELVWYDREEPHEVKLLPGSRVWIPMPRSDAWKLVDALAFTTLPRLRQLPDSN